MDEVGVVQTDQDYVHHSRRPGNRSNAIQPCAYRFYPDRDRFPHVSGEFERIRGTLEPVIDTGHN